MSNNISVNGNSLNYSGQFNADAKFVANDPNAKVADGNYGNIQSVTIADDGNYVVTTDKGLSLIHI